MEEEGLTLEEWKARALAAESLVQKLRGVIQKLEDDKTLLQELAEAEQTKGKKKNVRRSASKPPGRTTPTSSAFVTPTPTEDNLPNFGQSSTALDRGKAQRRRSNFLTPAEIPAFKTRYLFLEQLKGQESLAEFIEIFEKPTVPSQTQISQMWSEKIPKTGNESEATYGMELLRAPLPYLLELVLLGATDKITTIWDRDGFVREFAMVFRAFLTRKTLITHLTNEYSKAVETKKKEAIINFLKVWAEVKCAADFQDKKIKKLWDTLVLSIQSDKSMPVVGNFLMGYIENLTETPTNERRSRQQALSDATGEISILSVSAQEMARQITIRIEKLFRAIPRQEFFKGKCHKTKLLRDKAPHLMRFIKYVGHLGGWVLSEVLSQPDRKIRCQILERFIDITKHLRIKKNYMMVFTLIAPLQGVLDRLKKDWKEVSREHLQELDSLTTLVDSSGKFKNYYAELALASPTDPIIPMVQIAIGDVEKLDEITSDTVEGHPGWVHWYKYHMLLKCLAPVLRESPPYPPAIFKPNPAIQSYLKSVESWPSANATYYLSSLRESIDEWPKDVHRTPTKSIWDPSTFTFQADDWKYLVKVTDATSKKFVGGSEILTAGSANYHLYRIVKGEAATKTVSQGVKTFKPGEIFGELSLCVPGHTAPAKYTATSVEVEAQLIEFSVLGRKLVELPWLGLKFYHWLAYLLVKRLVTLDHDDVLLGSESNKATTFSKQKNWHNIFDIPESEDLEVFTCQLISGFGKSTVQLAVTPNQVALLRTNFGFTKIERSTIPNVVLTKKKKGGFQLNSWTLSGFLQNSDEIFTLISSLKEASQNKAATVTQTQESADSGFAERWGKTQLTVEMSPDDWDILLKGSSKQKIEKGTVILRKGGKSQVGRVFQLMTGSVHVVMNIEKPNEILATMAAPAIFGEISFLTGDIPTANIVAAEDIEAIVLDPFYLHILFQHYPDIGARFYFFLAQLIATRMKQRNIIN